MRDFTGALLVLLWLQSCIAKRSSALNKEGTSAPTGKGPRGSKGNMCAWLNDDSPEWVERLCRIAQEWKIGDGPVHRHFERASPDLSDSARAMALIRLRLAEEPALAEAWQTYSYDKRSRPNPYLDDCEVGYFDNKRRDVMRYDDRLDACADFIVREARWVLANE